MNAKFLASTLLAASLLGAPAVTFAQTSAPPDSTGPSGASTAQPGTMKQHHAISRHAKYRHHASATHMKRGTTIGMGSGARARPGGQSVSRKPAD